MNAFLFPVDYSSRPKVEQVIERFALIGYARLLLLLEDLAKAPEGDTCRRKYVYSALGSLLEAPPDVALEFIQALAEIGLVTLVDDGEFVTVTTTGICWPVAETAPSGPQLFTDPEQWAAWMHAEVGVPLAYAKGEAYSSKYRHWIASNVTTDEMERAITRTVEHGVGPTPAELHNQLKAVRAARIQEARQ
ncbi:hypothetical protein ACUN9V_18730 [Salinicola sp. V024]|uniref:hypothetical protein n=1 Tax=Salinicola sp. V024 TaxID=3459609 RepID=UPI0040441D03